MSEDTAALVERVRERFEAWRATLDGSNEMVGAVNDVVACFEAIFPVVKNQQAEIDSLTAALEREREASQIHEEAAVTERAYRNAAEARAQKAEAERDALRLGKFMWQGRAERAEAERDALQDLAEELRTRLLKAEAVVEAARLWREFATMQRTQALLDALAALDEQEQA